MAFALWRVLRARRSVVALEWLFLVERPVEQPALSKTDRVDVRLAAFEDAPRLARIVNPELVRLRLTRGDVGLVAEHEGRLVGCTWIAKRAHRLAGYHVRVEPGPGEVYAYGEIVERELRGRGIGQALLRAEFEEASRLGAASVLAHISLQNPVTSHLNYEVLGARVRERHLILVLWKRFGVPLVRRPGGDEHAQRARGPHPARSECVRTTPLYGREATNQGRDISRNQARSLLERSREMQWRFPSSSGNPLLASQDAWADQLLSERASFAAAARSLIENGDAQEATEMGANVWRLWVVARDPLGGRAFLAEVLDGSKEEPSRAKALALYGDGLLAFMVGAHEDSRARSEASLEAARAVQDPEALTLAHLGLSRAAFIDGDYERARSLAAQAREFARALDQAMGQAPLHMHAQGTRLAGDYDQAAALFEESLALNRRIDDQGMVGVELHNLGHVEIHRGNIDAAKRYFAECEQLDASDDAYAVAMKHLNRAVVAFARGENERAGALLADAESALATADTDPSPDDRFELDWLHRQLAEGSGGAS